MVTQEHNRHVHKKFLNPVLHKLVHLEKCIRKISNTELSHRKRKINPLKEIKYRFYQIINDENFIFYGCYKSFTDVKIEDYETQENTTKDDITYSKPEV